MNQMQMNGILGFINGDLTLLEALVMSDLNQETFIKGMHAFNHTIGYNNTIECAYEKGCMLCRAENLPLTKEIRRARMMGRGEIIV